MIICVILIGLICLYQIRFACSENNKTVLSDGIYNDYLSIDKTNSVKGIFVLLIFFSHCSAYLNLSDHILNKLYDWFNYGYLGQGIVAVFLFYSGYAMMLSGMEKGSSYVKSIPTKRVLKVLLHFDIAVCIFSIVQILLGKDITIGRFLLSLVGWSSVGNSNWYIFAILIFYLITYFAFLIGRDNKHIVLLTVFILTAVFVVLMSIAKESYWYDTALLYPLGMVWYSYRDKIESLFKKKKWLIYVAVAVLICVNLASLLLEHLIFKMIQYASLGLIIILLTMKVQIHNKILGFFGRHLFSIYILQRLPMNVLSYFGLDSKPIIFIALSFLVTIAVAIPFDMLLNKIDSYIFSRKSKRN